MEPSSPELATDLTFIRLQGRSYGNLLDWEEQTSPSPGQNVIAVDGSDRQPAVVSEVRPDGVIVLDFPDLQPRAASDSNPGQADAPTWASVPTGDRGRLLEPDTGDPCQNDHFCGRPQ